MEDILSRGIGRGINFLQLIGLTTWSNFDSENVVDGREIKVAARNISGTESQRIGVRRDKQGPYDLVYLLRHYGTGVADLAAASPPLLEDEIAIKAVVCYTAKKTAMHTDLITVDQCGYFSDWFPTV